MEDIKPGVTIIQEKPPAEPPPSQEFIQCTDSTQWLQDVQATAKQDLNQQSLTKIALLHGQTYTPFHKSASTHQETQQHLLTSRINTLYRTKYPQVQKLKIPTPKTVKSTPSFSSHPRDNETLQWINNCFDPWNKCDIQTPAPESEDQRTIAKWENMINSITTAPQVTKTNSHGDTVTERITICTDKVQSDTGANKAVTNNKNILYAYSDIEPYPIGGVKADDIAIVCTGQGLLPWQSREGEIIMVKTLYCSDVDGTIISPTTVVEQNQHKYYGFSIENDCDKGKGILALKSRTTQQTTTYDMTLENGLWYHHYNSSSPAHASIRQLNTACYSSLWHGRLAHIGEEVSSQMHKHVIGIDRPIKYNSFHRCPSCIPNKMSKVPHQRTNKHKCKNKSIREKTMNTGEPDTRDMFSDHPAHISDELNEKIDPGQHFAMDFGFVRGSGYKVKMEDAPTVTSIDGFNSYLIIVDKATRYIWLFLTASKSPPVEIARSVLRKFKSTKPHRTVRTDQGKELGKSAEFQKMLQEEGFVLELTGADASAQNGLAESPNKYLGNMMRCMLHAADLGPEYWSFALLHAVYIKNRVPHTYIKCTPFQAMTGVQPDLTNLRTFGCRIFTKKPGKRPAKLDHHTSNGIFLGYTSTMKNVYYIDDKTNVVKIGCHAIFDEVHFTVPRNKTPMAAQTLQCLGYKRSNDTFNKGRFTNDNLIDVKITDKTGIAPKLHSNQSGLIEIYSPVPTFTLPPGASINIDTSVTMMPPENSYLLINRPSQSNCMVENNTVYHNNKDSLVITMINNTTRDVQISQGQCIAHAMHQKIKEPTLNVTNKYENKGTKRSRRLQQDKTTTSTDGHKITTTAAPIPYNDDEIDHIDTPQIRMLTTDIEPPYQIDLCHDPFDTNMEITIATKGTHPTLGLHLITNKDIGNRLQLTECIKSTPAARISKWRSTLRGAFLQKVNNIPVHTITDVKHIVKEARASQIDDIPCTFATIQRVAMHPQHGTPLIYHDQLNVIAKHITEMKINDEERQAKHQQYLKAIQPSISTIKSTKKKAKLTRKLLKGQLDWNEWQQAEFKQLDQYDTQGMFSPPQPIPAGTNKLPFLWTYVIKDDGTKKARAPCNGSPRMQGTVTLGETFAASLDQTASRLFWALSAVKNHIVIGADASNAFAEAPAPIAPLYMTLDAQYHSWWRSKGRPPIPDGYGVRVLKAIQGHPESPRLWANLINRIITDMGFKPCKHEPCLYHHPCYKGHEIYFLRQVDDFAISTTNSDIAHEIINTIDQHMTIKVKPLGIINRFNGIDVEQSRQYIKLSNATYINKILETKSFKSEATHNLPLPMSNDSAYNRTIESSVPLDKEQLIKVEEQYGFGYRQAIGELIYAMVTCRPDISFPLIKLSQYSTFPSEEHFKAVKNIYLYLQATKEEGIYYWRENQRTDRDIGHLPKCPHQNNYTPTTREQQLPTDLRATVDSDYANDIQHRKSVTGINIKIAGGSIYYKTKFQSTVALSSTEAEFIAACEAAKVILYVRSILDDMGVHQNSATTLYEDNQGALLMANAGQPTKRTRHMETKHFAIQHWVDTDLLTLHRISTSDNESDAMTKNLPRTLFYRHVDYIMGKVIPDYVNIQT